MTVKLYDLANVTTATTGTGTMTLGPAVSGNSLTFAQAGVTDGETVRYGVKDGDTGGEVGYGVYSSTGPTLTRNVTSSTNSNNPINLSGSAEVFICSSNKDFSSPYSAGTLIPPTTSQFTLVEGVGGSATATNVSRGVSLNVQGAGATDRMAILEVTPGGATWSAVAQVCHQFAFRSFMFIGLVVRDSATGRLQTFNLCGDSSNQGQKVRVIRYSNMTTYNAEDFNYTTFNSYGSPIWFRLDLEAVNLVYYISSDGENWTKQYTIAKNSYVANIDRVGVVFDVNQNSALQNVAEAIILSSWSLT